MAKVRNRQPATKLLELAGRTKFTGRNVKIAIFLGEAFMHRTTRLFCLSAAVLLAPLLEINYSSRPVSADECYAVCKYKGKSGTTYVGISSSGCDSACDEAKNKCADQDDTPCEKIKCTATNCD
jgi:hypothetical protein